jgi:starch phosphorylase
VRQSAETGEVTVNATARPMYGVETLITPQPSVLLGIPFDRPIIGYGGTTVNTLRLWEAGAPHIVDFSEFSSGDFVAVVYHKITAEILTRVLYPDDSIVSGRTLRFAQEYFLVACSLADIVARFRRRGNDRQALPDGVAIHLNGTHPAMAVVELMCLLPDQGGFGWDQAWELTTRALAYTNHTFLPEALEKWPVELFEMMLPQQLESVCEINLRLLDAVRMRFPGGDRRLVRMSLIDETPIKQVRMANLAIVGGHSTNGLAASHSELRRTTVVKDFADVFPERFNNKTNGATPRRWLLLGNPDLSKLITEAIGDGWVTDLFPFRHLVPLADDAAFKAAFCQAKHTAKLRLPD